MTTNQTTVTQTQKLYSEERLLKILEVKDKTIKMVIEERKKVEKELARLNQIVSLIRSLENTPEGMAVFEKMKI